MVMCIILGWYTYTYIGYYTILIHKSRNNRQYKHRNTNANNYVEYETHQDVDNYDDDYSIKTNLVYDSIHTRLRM